MLDRGDFNKMMTFDETFFFYFCLPPIIFASGYNMKRRKFFENFKNILLFGLFGTVLQFALFTLFTWIIMNVGVMTKYNPETDVYEEFELSMTEIMLMCSLLCCTDVVAAISIIKYEEQPKLFSLVFGEGITNDAVCIILFNTVYEFSGPDSAFSASTPFKIFGSFVSLAFFSILTGVIWGLLSALALKHMRFLTTSTIIECNLVFCFGYLAYGTAELFHNSGIIALLTCGILMAHYAWYNLSQQAK
jgi:sodium/hydrogen exchanger-like protein 6/7/sodium/hydrogen exchanger 8